jgi:predicted nuclease with RNAse H fold
MSPWSAAGERSRADERALARAVCSIRYTPDEATLRAPHRSDYYGWVLQGLDLFAALATAEVATVECFPTASVTRWAGPRGTASRARWSTAALESLGVAGVAALGQDGRDAVLAAMTARAHAAGATEAFGDIVVPCPR